MKLSQSLKYGNLDYYLSRIYDFLPARLFLELQAFAKSSYFIYIDHSLFSTPNFYYFCLDFKQNLLQQFPLKRDESAFLPQFAYFCTFLLKSLEQSGVQLNVSIKGAYCATILVYLIVIASYCHLEQESLDHDHWHLLFARQIFGLFCELQIDLSLLTSGYKNITFRDVKRVVLLFLFLRIHSQSQFCYEESILVVDFPRSEGVAKFSDLLSQSQVEQTQIPFLPSISLPYTFSLEMKQRYGFSFIEVMITRQILKQAKLLVNSKIVLSLAARQWDLVADLFLLPLT